MDISTVYDDSTSKETTNKSKNCNQTSLQFGVPYNLSEEENNFHITSVPQ